MMTNEETELRWFEAQAEDAYDKLYDARTPGDATARYSDAKEAFHSAIGIARQLGRTDDATRLETRLAHIKSVFRTQFS